ncbi:MAG: Imm1 family immunity protein [Hyphomicrobiales bacterium]
MRRWIYFDKYDQVGWPDLHELEPFFLAPKGQEWSYNGGNDSWSLSAEGLEGTEHLDRADARRIDLHLNMWGHPELGVLLMYEKIGGPYDDLYSSKGDMRRIGRHVRTLHGTQLPEGLFIPFREAWKAVKEFIETDGALPKSISWVENSTLPKGTFPPP